MNRLRHANFISTTLFLLMVFISRGQTPTALNQLDEQGKRHGIWKGIYDKSKLPRYEGQFEHGKEVGLFTYFENATPSTVMATREFSATEDACYTIFYTPEKKKVSEGWVRNRQFDGEWKYYHYNAAQIMTLETYDNGKLIGVRKVFYKNGALAEEQAYDQGKKSGVYKKYAENGALLELSNFVGNEYDGMAEFKNPNGAITGKGLFKNGKKVGMWTILQDGKLIQVNMNKKPRKFAKKSERLPKK